MMHGFISIELGFLVFALLYCLIERRFGSNAALLIVLVLAILAYSGLVG